VLPAQQRLDADEVARLQLDDRLVAQAQLVALDGAPQPRLELQALQREPSAISR
jgi:hypothetical protein